MVVAVASVASVVVVVAVLIKMDWPGGGTPEVIVQNWGTVMLWRWRWRWWMWMERWRMLVERCSTVMNDSMGHLSFEVSLLRLTFLLLLLMTVVLAFEYGDC